MSELYIEYAELIEFDLELLNVRVGGTYREEQLTIGELSASPRGVQVKGVVTIESLAIGQVADQDLLELSVYEHEDEVVVEGGFGETLPELLDRVF